MRVLAGDDAEDDDDGGDMRAFHAVKGHNEWHMLCWCLISHYSARSRADAPSCPRCQATIVGTSQGAVSGATFAPGPLYLKKLEGDNRDELPHAEGVGGRFTGTIQAWGLCNIM